MARIPGMAKTALKPTGKCWCGCGTDIGKESFFAAGHDKRAESMLLKLLYGSENTVAAFLAAHGFGDEKSLTEAAQATEGGILGRKMRGPSETIARLSNKDLVQVAELIAEIEEHFDGGNNEPYEEMWFQERRAPERVWDEVVRQAQEAGWDAVKHAGVVKIERPDRGDPFRIGDVG